MKKQSPGRIIDISNHQLSPGVEVARGRTILDAKKVFVIIDGRRMSLEKALQRTEKRKGKTA